MFWALEVQQLCQVYLLRRTVQIIFTGSVCSYFAGIATSLSVLIASADLDTSAIKFTGQGAAGTTMAIPSPVLLAVQE
jgi:hypothetical protein